jgi:hypothetical protein
MEHITGEEVDDPKVLGVLEELDAIAITEILDHDSRPTFIIDLGHDLDTVFSPDKLPPIFCNTSLRLYERVLDTIAGDEPIDELKVWRHHMMTSGRGQRALQNMMTPKIFSPFVPI